jgi:putative chitinase
MSALKILQERAEITPDGIFGPTTFRECSKILEIDDHRQAVHFWAQCAHETGNFKAFEENLNYSAAALKATWPNRFPGDLAEEYHRQPEKIANFVYQKRMGNGDAESGDGWRYRGRGALQLTGKANYRAFMEYKGIEDILEDPDCVSTFLAFDSAMFFFFRNRLWTLCMDGFSDETITKLTRRINGGTNGLQHRIELTKKFSKYSL